MINVTLITNGSRDNVLVSENKTLREVLEENDINYAVGQTAIDGCPINAGDMDSSFADLGVTEKCYLSVVVKAMNAATMTAVGGAVVLTSEATLEDIKLIQKYEPKKLCLYDEDGNAIFAVATTEDSAGTINKYGVEFGPRTNAEGKAMVTLVIGPDVEDVAAALEEKYGRALLKLEQLEQTFAEVIDEIRAEQETVKAHITVM